VRYNISLLLDKDKSAPTDVIVCTDRPKSWRLTERAARVLQRAEVAARICKARQVQPQHVLAAGALTDAGFPPLIVGEGASDGPFDVLVNELIRGAPPDLAFRITSATDPMTALEANANVGIVVVHGIGRQRETATSARVAQSLISTFRFSGVHAVSRADGKAVHLSLFAKGRNQGAVTVYEAHWAHEAASNPASRLRSGFETTAFVFCHAPILITALLGTDYRDLKTTADELLLRDTATAVRLAARVGLLSIAIASLPTWLGVGVIFSLILLYAIGPLRSVDSVRRVITDDDFRTRAVQRVTAAVAAAAQASDRVVIIGHSQGGYLAHRCLRTPDFHAGRGVPPDLVAVGSGLKVISLLESAHRVRTVRGRAAAWSCLVLAAGSLLCTYQGMRPLLRWLYAQLSLWAGRGSLPRRYLEVHADVSARYNILVHHASWLSGWRWFAVAACLAVASVAVGGIATALWTTALAQASMTDSLRMPKGRVASWTEFSSLHDSVSRLAVLRLPAPAEEIVCPAPGQALLDHLYYFRPPSAAIGFLANMISWRIWGPASTSAAALDLRARVSRAQLKRVEQRRSVWLLFTLMVLVSSSWFEYGSHTGLLPATPSALHALRTAFALAFVGMFFLYGLSYATLARSASIQTAFARRLVRSVNSVSRVPPLHYVSGALLVGASVVGGLQDATWSSLPDLTEIPSQAQSVEGGLYLILCAYFGLRQLVGRNNHWVWPLLVTGWYSNWTSWLTASTQGRWLAAGSTKATSLSSLMTFSGIATFTWFLASIKRGRSRGAAHLLFRS
jgi:hypothetical protein